MVAAERQPGYLASPLAPHRLKLAMPNVKIVVVLRDPVDRYYSELRARFCVDKNNVDWDDINNSFAQPGNYKHYLSTAVVDFSPLDKLCLGVGASAADLWTCDQNARKSHRPLLRGLYEGQVNRWLRAFGKDQVKIINSKDLFSKPEKVAADVASFAGLSPHEFFEFGTDREASCDPRQRGKTISSAYSKRKESEPSLRKWYAEHNSMLFEDLGVDLGWNDRIKS
ncbi:unnamed protein product, partial [Sphacelaria rigidula]